MNTDTKVLQIPIEDIIPNRFQPRLAFDNDSLQELSNSIKEHGIIQPLVIRRIGNKYEIIAGERRYKAAIMAGLTSVPAIITNLTDNESAEVAIVENVQRKDLTAIEEAKSYKALLDKGYMSQDDLAKKMGLSQSAISNKLRLLSLAEEVQNAILEGKISERHARCLLKIDSLEEQKKILKKIIDERLTVKQLEEEIKKIIKPVNKEQNTTSNEEIKMNTENKMPNKFFNFLEDTSANMNIIPEEPPREETIKETPVDIFNINPESLTEEKNPENQISEAGEEIELLDDDFNNILAPVTNLENETVHQIKELIKNNPSINIVEEPLENGIKLTIIINN